MFENQGRVFLIIIVLVFVLFVGRLWQLQVIEGGAYNKLATENGARIIPIIAPRGIIYDRNKKLVVGNRAIFSVYIIQRALPVKKLPEVVSRLANIVGISQNDILYLINKKKALPFEPVLIKDNLSMATVARLKEEERLLTGVVVNYRPVRTYPYGKTAAHLLGYVGEVTKDELDRLEGYKLGDLLGKDGVEKSYDKYLRGTNGGEQVEVDAYGKPIRVSGQSDPIPGKDMILTVDIELQRLVDEFLADKEGGVVVLDPRNGEILALSSSPSYDPAIFAKPMEQWEMARLDNAGHPFMNRALSVYPPGSTFKSVTLSSILEEKNPSLTELFHCIGEFRLGNRIAKCWLEGGHGSLGILEGLVWSCDVVFYELGLRAGPDLMAKYANGYGLGTKTGVDLPQEMDGFIPTPKWKEKTFKIPWVRGDSINYAIGQGFVQVTPLQMANLYATIAIGERYQPHAVSQVLDRSGKAIFTFQPKKIGTIPISKTNQELLQRTLREVIRRGTGVAARVKGIPAAGKTGTAENPGLAHAWFMCYAPYTTPEVVVSSFVAHGEHGDRVTAYIAREVLTWYVANRLEKPVEEKEEEAFPPQYIMHGARKDWY